MSVSQEKTLSPKKLAHVVLRTKDLKRMNDFYQKFLGAEIVYGNEFLSFLTYDDEHHRIAIAEIPTDSPKDEASSGLDHIAFTFDTLEDLTRAYTQRKEHGITPFWCVNHGPTTSMYYKDPDGNKLETQVDNFDSNAEANAFMRSKEFAENPIGTDFDPDELIRRLQSGEDVRKIKKRVEIGPRGLPPQM
ncbi:uncharacterized protein A1O5_02343 [Cladophialophora psammophila CBS 110553]|uniref:VOC domain-containing protein n=1 Tax=Cladophialophora psammophila CBS 110553 TaxID=1182543 RepID=W9XUV6_9EURO|nr:uncharacterized protein A1O5_02343 [Cladophialophora psammophila CBS 110553]EXJ74049.1 hypothetical protein A1O5_02343 [Cladophialophora psammophila CBS 110553]